MSKTAKRYNKTEKKVVTKTFRAGIYARLSTERKESYREKSNSIESQIYYAKEYAKKENIEIVDKYIDYEYSGTNFNRPGYLAMMEDVKARRINCIIIRDLSRLGREHLKMGRLIDKVFPFLGVRFISVTENLDTEKGTDTNKAFEVIIKNIINDMYSKDISIKVSSAKMEKVKKGYFIGSVPPYGYKVNKENKNGQTLEIDENTSVVVKDIFSFALLGKSHLEIAKYLNENKITTPMVYFRTNRMIQEESDPKWSFSSVTKILKKEVYIGNMVQGKKRQSLAKGEKQRYLNESEWIVVENTHEPIISKEDFNRVREISKKNREESYFSYPERNIKRQKENRYKGLIFWKDTGKEMVRINYLTKDSIRYLFKNIHNPTYETEVYSIREDFIDETVRKAIFLILKEIGNKKKYISNIEDNCRNKEISFRKDIKKYDRKIKELKKKIQISYEKFTLGHMREDNYFKIRADMSSFITIYKSEINELESRLLSLSQNSDKAKNFINDLYKAKSSKKLSKDLLNSLINKIYVNDKKEIEIEFNIDLERLENLYD